MRPVLAAFAVFAWLLGAGPASGQDLLGAIDDAGAIGLVRADGTAVTNLAPGTYSLRVVDSSSVHDFNLFGTGAVTPVTGEGTFDFTVTLAAGEYTYRCDVHSYINGSFTVGLSLIHI